MNNEIFILDEVYLLNSDEIKNIKNKNNNNNNKIITGNSLYKIFNFDINIDLNNYEYYDDSDIIKILKISKNHLCYSNITDKFYITKFLKKILNEIKNNTFSVEYINYLFNQVLKCKYNIYDSIDKLDIDKFTKLANKQFDLIKYSDFPILPINYCESKLNTCKNSIKREIYNKMYNILINYNYEINPKYFSTRDNNFYIFLKDLIYTNKVLFLKCINIFNLDYTDEKFMNLILESNEVIDILINININNNSTYAELLLILNKINIFVDLINNGINYELNFNKILPYLIKYNSNISFYYILENYKVFDKINIILPLDFLKIYLYFNDNIINYLYLLIDKNVDDLNMYKLILIQLVSLNDKFNDKFIILIKNIINKNNFDIIKLFVEKFKNEIKNILKTTDILFFILDNCNEDLFYYLLSLFNQDEFINLVDNLKDNEENTIYHYICKNNICLGFNINNGFRNKKGFKPMDLCIINKSFYKNGK